MGPAGQSWSDLDVVEGDGLCWCKVTCSALRGDQWEQAQPVS